MVFHFVFRCRWLPQRNCSARMKRDGSPPTSQVDAYGSNCNVKLTAVAYGSNCNVKLTAVHRLKPSSKAKSHEGSITAWLRSSLPTSAQNEAR